MFTPRTSPEAREVRARIARAALRRKAEAALSEAQRRHVAPYREALDACIKAAAAAREGYRAAIVRAATL